MKILAIDFETAGYARNTACSIGLALFENGHIVAEAYELICPPCNGVMFAEIHGLTWADLADKPSFGNIWPKIENLLSTADVFAAHNAVFDRQVLNACATFHEISLSTRPWLCTLEISRSILPLAAFKLSDVCAHLKIDLDHHNAMSDARACASIIMHAQRANHDLARFVRHH